MPSTDAPIVGLGGALFSLLLGTLAGVVLVALSIGAGAWIIGASDRPIVSRSRDVLFGASPLRAEPRARLFLRIAFGLLWIADGLLQAQPKMPAGFVGDILGPGVASGPGWFGDLVAPVARAWTRHPVVADAATVWVQVGFGLLILLGGRGWLAKVALWGSILWSLVVWSIGEAFGGLLASGASWLSGAPGAVLVYLAASGLLLAPWDWWDSGRAGVIARRFTAVWLLFGAVLQVLPGERQWTSPGLASMFADGASRPQPAPLVRPIMRLATFAANDPAALNAVIVVLLVSAATALWFTGRTAVIVAAVVLCAVTWWLAQDFGVLGGTATDPNAAFPLGLLLATALPSWRRTAESAAVPAASAGGARRVRTGLGAVVVTLALGLTVVVPAILASTLGRPADAVAGAADSGGGWRRIPPRTAPPFALTDQRGQPVALSSLRGKLVLLTFLDPVCTSDCPLIANQIAVADRELGTLAERVEFVAIDSNPVFHFVADVNAFTQSHGLGGVANWHFLCGPSDTAQGVLADYGISVDVPAVGMIQHSEGMYVITADGREAAYLDDGAGTQLTGTYADQLRDEIRSLLK